MRLNLHLYRFVKTIPVYLRLAINKVWRRLVFHQRAIRVKDVLSVGFVDCQIWKQHIVFFFIYFLMVRFSCAG